MSERLTYRGTATMTEDGMITPSYSDYSMRKIIQKLAEYEDLEEQVQQYRVIEHRLEDMFGGKMFLKDYVDKLEWTIEETAERCTPKKPINNDI